MTKRIIALALAVVMAACVLVACDNGTTTEAPKTEAPKTTAPAGTADGTTAAPATTAPATTPVVDPTVPATTPSADPTVVADPFDQWGGFDYMMGTSEIYSKGWEVWPAKDNGKWCGHAFWQFCMWHAKSEKDFTENLGTPDYEYTWTFYFKDEELENTVENWSTGYECAMDTFYDGGEKVIYRVQTDVDFANGPCSKFEVGKNYEIVFNVTKDGANQGFMYLSITWDEDLDARFDCYTHFWSTEGRDRSQGYTTGMNALTDADYAYAQSKGFKNFTADSDDFGYVGVDA